MSSGYDCGNPDCSMDRDHDGDCCLVTTTREVLAELIWRVSRMDEGTISATGANLLASAILASDWLAARDASIREDALGPVRELMERWSAPGRSSRDKHHADVLRSLLDRQEQDSGRADVWDEGYRSGHSNAMRRMSDEPDAPTTPNPYRAVIDTPAQADGEATT